MASEVIKAVRCNMHIHVDVRAVKVSMLTDSDGVLRYLDGVRVVADQMSPTVVFILK